MKNMISKTALVALSTMLLTVISVGVEAAGYGGVKSATKVCKAPKLVKKQPVQGSVVNLGDDFSAQASKKIKKDSIKVSIKGKPVDVAITTSPSGRHTLKGIIPADITAKFARIKVTARDVTGCTLSDGWLLKIGGAEAAPAEAEAPAADTAAPAADTEEAVTEE